MVFRKLVLIDLDGVINQYEGKYNKDVIPPVKEGADKFLEFIITTLDCDLKLFTTRPKELAQNWLVEYNLDKYFKDVTDIKEPAYLMIDDRCIKHTSFDDTIKQILYFCAEQEIKKYDKLKAKV